MTMGYDDSIPKSISAVEYLCPVENKVSRQEYITGVTSPVARRMYDRAISYIEGWMQAQAGYEPSDAPSTMLILRHRPENSFFICDWYAGYNDFKAGKICDPYRRACVPSTFAKMERHDGGA